MPLRLAKTERIRDPIHGFIPFKANDETDAAAWKLLQTADFQRLRRIKQLGVSEFVFPSATHSRFAHSIGVFHNARQLVRIIQREIVPDDFDRDRAKVAVLAALLHDIGHGPFSHAFEEARKTVHAEQVGQGSSLPNLRKHEYYSATLITDANGEIASILAEANVDPMQVADLIEADNPVDMYHAVVSSSFDADRLDYLMRDRYMTGTGAGAIDLEWLLDNVRVSDIDVAPPESDAEEQVLQRSFCLSYKAREAAEDFLLARYRLYSNVYTHKTTRGIEQVLSALFRTLARELSAREPVAGLADDHPLVHFFWPGGDTMANYRRLDDTVVWGAIHALAVSGAGHARELCQRLLNRDKPRCLDVGLVFPDDPERQRRLKRRLDSAFDARIGRRVFRDTAKLSIYGEIGADERRAQKRLMIRLSDGSIREITDFHDLMVRASDVKRTLERYYFLDQPDYRLAQELAKSL
jgi:HD superfamily phosphohydrolase